MNTEETTLNKFSAGTCPLWDGGIPGKEDVVRTAAKYQRLQKGGCDHGFR